VSPNGRNINQNCGALHPEVVAAEVVDRKADVGVSFDGDADRALFADHTGKVVNGDAVLLLMAREMHAQGELTGQTVVATTMSNMGLEAALKDARIKMVRAPVGDKYVLEEMLRTGAVLGGEQSGHIILAGRATTGDGLLTALRVLEVVGRSGKPLAELADLKVFPQIIKNVKVREKKPLEQLPDVMAAIRRAEADLNDEGRVVVRYSGTESLCRVMIEAASAEKMNKHADEISSAMQRAVGI
jgi:phosphoglucosamine mutase